MLKKTKTKIKIQNRYNNKTKLKLVKAHNAKQNKIKNEC